MLIGNKVDCFEEERQVSRRDAEKLASQLDIAYFESSAKEDINVTEVIEYLLRNIPDEAAEVLHTGPENSLLNVTDLDKNNNASSCSC